MKNLFSHRKPIRVVSLFDGMSCARVALERAGIPIEKYFASEIDKYAMTVAQRNYSDTIQLGDVRLVRQMAEAGLFGKVDLLIGGSPCQGFSFAGKQLAFDDPRSALFFEYVHTLKALQIYNPDIRFLLENVKMKKEHLAVISQLLGVQPVCINSALVSAQNRVRYYWANWTFGQPADRGIYLRDIIEDGEVDRDKSYCIDANYYKGGSLENYMSKARRQIILSPSKLFNVNPSGNGMTLVPERISGAAYGRTADNLEIRKDEKANALLSEGHQSRFIADKSRTLRVGGLESPPTARQNWVSFYDGIPYRKLTVIECERLQTLWDGYTAGVSNTQRYKMIGNGWNIDTIVGIFERMPT